MPVSALLQQFTLSGQLAKAIEEINRPRPSRRHTAPRTAGARCAGSSSLLESPPTKVHRVARGGQPRDPSVAEGDNRSFQYRAVAGLLSDPAVDVRIAAIAALGNLDYVSGGRRAAVTISPPTATLLAQRYTTEVSPLVRSEIIKGFALLDVEQVRGIEAQRDSVIGAALDEASAANVQFAVIGVGRQQLEQLLPRAVALLRHADAMVRMAASQAVGTFGTRARPHLSEIEAAAERETDSRIQQTLRSAIERIRGGGPGK